MAQILDEAGVYAILTYAPNWSPWPYRPVYFGESGGVRQRATAAHESHPLWRKAAGEFAPLYRAFHLMPDSNEHQRREVESRLIAAYSPPCNRRLGINLADVLGAS